MTDNAAPAPPQGFDWKRRLRAVAVIAAIVGVLGLIGILRPIDDAGKMVRFAVNRQAPSADIVVAAIDEKSLSELGRWPWPRTHHAKLTDRLNQAGAKAILFDIDLSAPSNAVEDRAFENALRRSRVPVTLAGRFVIDPLRNVRLDVLPLSQFQRVASVANINFWRGGDGTVWTLPYTMEMAGSRYRGMGAAIAGVPTPRSGEFAIDYSLDLRAVPTISVGDIVGGRVPAEQLRGKTVVIGTATETLGDISTAPGHGMVPGVYIHVIGAETLRRGIPVDAGVLPPLLVAAAFAAAMAMSRRRRSILVLLGAGVAINVAAPFVLEQRLIFVEVAPAVVMLLTVGIRFLWQDLRRKYEQVALVNPVSGLPNLEALRLEPEARESLIIVMRVLNFADIISSLDPEQERAMVEQIAQRLSIGPGKGPFQSDDALFAFLHPQTELGLIAGHLAAIQALFRSPVVVGDAQFDLTLTLGVDREVGRPVANRLSAAMVAAEQAAAEGVDWKCHDPSQLEDSAWRLSMLSQLSTAIDAGDLWVAYQPKYDVATKQIVGAEALARWTHPDKGPIRPDIFIGAAEQSNRIEKLTLHVLDDAVATAVAVRETIPDFVMAVNLSAKLLEGTQIVSQVRDILARHRLPAAALILELTETAALGSDSQSLSTLHALRGLGLGVAIDDYGTGMSTLDYLKRVPATEIKIDRSFVQSLDGQENDRLLVSSTIQLAHLLGLKVVAEGVERREALDILARMGCDLAQGYLLSHPVPKSSLLAKIIPLPARLNAA